MQYMPDNSWNTCQTSASSVARASHVFWDPTWLWFVTMANYLWERGAEWISDSVFGKQYAPWEQSQKKDEENGIQVCQWKCPVLQESCTLGGCIAEHMPRTEDRINPSRASSPTFYSLHSKPQRWEMSSEPVGECSLAFKMACLITPMVSLSWLHLGISLICLILTKLCHLLNRLN